jgi:hypothetical protein
MKQKYRVKTKYKLIESTRKKTTYFYVLFCYYIIINHVQIEKQK